MAFIANNFLLEKYEAEQRTMLIKVDRLNTFNKEMRSRLDYFISLLQNLNLNQHSMCDNSSALALPYPIYPNTTSHSRTGFIKRLDR